MRELFKALLGAREEDTHHLLHQIIHYKALFVCSDIGHPHPAVFMFIVNNKHVSFKETDKHKVIYERTSKL